MWTSPDVVLVFILLLWSCRTSAGLSDHGDMRFFDAPMSFTVESTVLLNDLARRDKEVSYKLNATLQLLPLRPPAAAAAGGPDLVKFTVLNPYLLGRGTHVNAEYMPLSSPWDSYSQSDFYVHNNNGTFSEIYVDPSEPEDLINFKRSLLSLFQFSYTPNTGNETDFSGTCEVQYEVMSDQVIRKVKRRCSDEAGGAAGAASRRVARYSRDARGPQEVYAEEVHELHAALKARAWLRLRRAPAPAARPHLVAAIPSALVALPLAVPVPDEDGDESQKSVEELEALMLETSRLTGAEAPGARAADAALRLLPALRAAAPPALAALLDRAAAAGDRRLAEACGALGAAGSPAALDAVRARLAAPGAEHLALRYYEGLALSLHPDEGVVMEALRVGEAGGAGGAGAAVAASALLAAGAAGTRLPPAAAAAVRARLLRALQDCQEEECTARGVRALGNMRHADDADLLLRHAGGGGAAARAALGALAVGPATALYNVTRLRRLERAAQGGGGARGGGERAAALELLLARGAPAPVSLLPLLLDVLERAPAELRQLAWGRLAALAESDPALRALRAALPALDGGWATRAWAGHSAAVERDVGGGAGRAALRASLLESAGALARAELTLTTPARAPTVDHVVTLELRNLSDAGSVLLLPTVDGVLLRPRPLRDNRTALSVLRLTSDERGARALLGGGVLRLRRRAARAGALRAGAAGRLAARGAAAARVEARVAGAWGELGAAALSWTAPRVRLLVVPGGCTRADVAPLEAGSELRLWSALGAARRRVRRVRGAQLPVPGCTLPLADPLRASCR